MPSAPDGLSVVGTIVVGAGVVGGTVGVDLVGTNVGVDVVGVGAAAAHTPFASRLQRGRCARQHGGCTSGWNACTTVPLPSAPDGLSVVGTVVVGASVGVDVGGGSAVGASVGVAAAHTSASASPALVGPCGDVPRAPLPAMWYS